MSRASLTFLVMCVGGAFACASPSPKPSTTEGSAKEPVPAVPATGVATSPVVPEPTVAAKPAAPPSEPVAKQGRDHRSVVACTTDADCGWDDPCMAKRCVEPLANFVGCDKSVPPPGTCTCVEGACTLKPDAAPAPSGTCESRGCVVDRAAGTCVADTGGVAENLRFTAPVEVGPSCDCLTPAKGCQFTWFAAVPCKTDRDCWIDHLPRTHPVARPKALRKRDFKPCKDGETAPKCGPAGRCVIGPAYKC